jgi:hypothetical protein
VEELLLREANRPSGQALEAGAQGGQVLALEALQGRLAFGTLGGGQLVYLGPPGIGKPMRHGRAQAGEHGPQATESGVCAPAQHEGQHPARADFFHPPKPPGPLFGAHERPHLVST